MRLPAVGIELGQTAARRVFEAAVSRINTGRLTIESPSGSAREFDSGAPGPAALLRVHDPVFYQHVMLHGEVGFGEAYQNGWCSSPDLIALVRLAVLNRRAVNLNSGPLRLVSKLGNRRLHLSRKNTEEQSKHNIHAPLRPGQ